MFETKKDVDQHVKTALSKIKSENEKKLRGFTIAKLYYKVNEYEIARHYICNYLSCKETAPAHRFLGQCYLKLKNPTKALESFQRSLQLDPKQSDLLVEVCKMFLNNDNMNLNKAKYWCDLAESEKVQDDAIFTLRLKLLGEDNTETKQVEELILKEISQKPNDPNLKIRLIKHYIEQNKILDAFKYAYVQELKYHDQFYNNSGWYNSVWLMLTKYKQEPNTFKDRNFWLLLILCLEKQIEISLLMSDWSSTETSNLLFNFDQYLFEIFQSLQSIFPEKEFSERFINHFKGQFCLHAAALIFKREQVQNKNQWKETTKNALPLLLLAFQCGSVNVEDPWLKRCGNEIKDLIQIWNPEGAFRCSQAGRCLLSCIEKSKNNSISSQVHRVVTEKLCWSNADELLSQARSFCSDSSWRNKIFRILFANSDQIRKMSTSFLINSKNTSEPIYELPSYADIESYEEIAQYFRPQSLQHMVYLCLGVDNLCDIRCKDFSGLNFSTQNLHFCGSESLNQLDIETFLYAASIQSKRLLEVERIHNDNYNSINVGKPLILPFVNMKENLCTEEQSKWWYAAYQTYRNLIYGENLAEIRMTLQYGIETVRGINGPKMDLMIILKLGKIFSERVQDSKKPIEKNYLEIRTDTLYKHALEVYKLHTKGILDSFRKLFKYSNSSSVSVDNEIIELAEEAVQYLAARYFKKTNYEECIEEFTGLQLPFATYFQAEAYRKLDESNKTPKKTKKLYLEKIRDCLNQTVNLLNNSNISKNHPLNSIVHSEIKRLQFINQISNDTINGHFSDNREFYQPEESLNLSYYGNRSGRELPPSSKLVDLENLVKQIATSLTLVKDEIGEMIKPEFKETRNEIKSMKSEIKELRDKMSLMEETIKKKNQAPIRDNAPNNVIEDLCLMNEELQNQLYPNHNMYSGFQQHMSRIHPPMNIMPPTHHPSVLPQAHHPQAHGALYSDYFQAPSYVTPIPGSFPNQDRQNLGFNQRLSYSDASNNSMNFSMPSIGVAVHQQPSLPQIQHQQISVPQLDNRANLFNFMTPPPSTQPSLGLTNKFLDKSPVPPPTIKPAPASAFWNRTANNAPVEKGPPVNVVITSSDPLPTNTVAVQPTLSVTIPPQHIKSSFTSNELNTEVNAFNSNNTFPISSSFSSTAIGSNLFSLTTNNQNQSSISITTTPIIGNENNLKHLQSSFLNQSTESNDGEVLNKSESENVEYDPRPDFKPIIPLPAEVEVKTGEEDESVLFCSRAKLFRHIDKEWKERGIGNIKILKNKIDGKLRILMRRDQTHKICANHYITEDMNLIKHKNDEKSYVWAAKDFADEEEKSEKLCIRFKQIETAKEFCDAFTKAKEELKNNKIEEIGSSVGNKEKEIENSEINDSLKNSLGKSSIFNFAITLSTDTTSNAAKPFSNIFGNSPLSTTNTLLSNDTSSNVAKPFSNLFGNSGSIFCTNNTSSLPSFVQKPTNSDSNSNNLNTEDDFVPTAEFKPVIPLPDLVEVQTGEENETVLFEHRAKLFRFDKTSNEWKEKGIGNIKLLVERNNLNCARILMRREQVLKVCINLRLNKTDVFKFQQSNSNAIQFGGQDFSEEPEGKAELFTVRFKTAETCKLFHDAILNAQSNMTEASGGEKSDRNISNNSQKDLNKKQEKQGFGDKFKPKPGSWQCDNCYVSNNSENLHCMACDSPKDNTVPAKPKNASFTGIDLKGSTNKFTFGFGVTESSNKTVVPETGAGKTTEVKGFGDKFKPKAGSWDCKSCYLSNEGNASYCLACGEPKDDTVPKQKPDLAEQQKNVFTMPNQPKTSFTFGFGNNTVSTSGTTDTLNKDKPFEFSFTPSTGENNFLKSELKSLSKFSFPHVPLTNFNNDSSVSSLPSKPQFSFNKSNKNAQEVIDDSKFKLEKKEFNFVMKPKSPGKAKSPLKNTSGAEDDSDVENVEEENNTYFAPVIPLPDKVDVKTGEENENVLYCHRAKLFRFVDSEWKERGLGDIKILQHKETKKLRVVMRREQILKICLNHVLNEDVKYMQKDDKSWHFVVEDFSEGELELTQFCLRFKTKEIADGFMSAVKKALAPNEIEEDLNKAINNNEENRKLAEKLMLPLDFYDNLNTCENCKGCRGCDSENFNFPQCADDVKEENPLPLYPKDFNQSKTNTPILKQSSFSLLENTSIQDQQEISNKENQEDNISTTGTKSSNIFNLGDNIKFNSFNVANLSGQKLIFGGCSDLPAEKVIGTSEEKEKSNVFNTFSFVTLPSSDKVQQQKSAFQSFSFGKPAIVKNDSKFSFGSNSNNNNSSSNNSEIGKIFGTNFEKLTPSSTASTTATATEIDSDKIENSENNMFKDPGISFSELAAKTSNVSFKDLKQQNTVGGFIGLTQNDAFRNFVNPNKNSDDNSNTVNNLSDVNANNSSTNESNNDDANYDPHYEPIIELPEEIKVVTGEENEEKLFGERSTLFRYDSETKEWKERGVGELKVLYHPENGTYRLLLRREQIHKLVLNHAITDDFVLKLMNNTGKAFCWSAQNFAEEPIWEKLACRFKHVETANKFETIINDCIKQLKSRADLEPEDD